MIKKILIFVSVLFIFSTSVFSIEMGLILGSIDNPREGIYGFSAGSGMLIPLVKFEIEYYNLADRRFEAVTIGLKIRKKFRKIAPYAVLGVGSEFKNLTFDIDKFETFFFIGGGFHFYISSFLSLRADLRFQNFKEISKTRISIGAFFSL
jgi:hypothetical protein